MELCSGKSPEPLALRNVGRISTPISSVYPPIENWYVVVRESSGESRIYSSWENYQEDSSSSENREAIQDGGPPEVAAFPTMAQAIKQLKRYNSEYKLFPTLSSTIEKLNNCKSDSKNGNDRNNIHTRVSPPQPPGSTSKSNATIATRIIDSLVSNDSIGGSLPMPPAFAAVPPANQIIVNSGEGDNRERLTATALKSTPRSILSSNEEKMGTGRMTQATKTPYGITIPSVPLNKIVIPTVPASMSTRMARTDMSDPKRSKLDTSNLDALAIAANNSNTADRSMACVMGRGAVTSCSKILAKNSNFMDGAQPPPASIIAGRGAACSADARRAISSNLLIGLQNSTMSRSPSPPDPVKDANLHKPLSTTLRIPEVPTALSGSLKIPEVPRGIMTTKAPDSLNQTLSSLKRSNDASSSSSLSNVLMMSTQPPQSQTLDFYSQQKQQEQYALYNRRILLSHLDSTASYRNQLLHPQMDTFRQRVELNSFSSNDSEVLLNSGGDSFEQKRKRT